MPEVFAAVVNGRHCDPEPHVFSDKTAAIDWARREAKCLCRGGDMEEWCEEQDVPGRLFSAKYSCEGDSVWVQAVTIDAEIK